AGRLRFSTEFADTVGDADLPFSAAADRNKAVVLEVLARLLPAHASVLEIASGTGQHAAHCAAARPGWRWQPTDYAAAALPAIAARCAALPNVRAPQQLDVLAEPWPASLAAPEPAGWRALYCANMIHISPWATCAGLMRGAAALLAPDGQLVLYGPYLEDEVPTSPGNLSFDADLRARNPAWGLRRRADVQASAAAVGLVLQERVAVPANNLMLVFARRAPGP
ncbi:MAG: hypothetical protein RLZZ584_4412, partial [Pseudomonadota bacterium]